MEQRGRNRRLKLRTAFPYYTQKTPDLPPSSESWRPRLTRTESSSACHILKMTTELTFLTASEWAMSTVSVLEKSIQAHTHTQTHHFDLHRRRLWPYLVHWRLSWGRSCCRPSLQHLCVPAPGGVWLSLSALPDETALSVCNNREWVWRHKTTLMTVQF